ncbi:hypothetical protein JZ751_014180 [Albula glossodonta]|uniref:B30.2/SPRY domain-containing protein n=1 Tax=Albula glossodonta TaxID=121402 RepID=A0A8T2NVS3_9TELE|nr:hypothetical protein JZ751_014180 [Albula glossodonta]
MKQLQERLQKAESTLQQVQDIQDPFTLLQKTLPILLDLSQRSSQCDVALKEVCPARIQKGVLEVMGVRPAALARDVPLFHILLRAFTGEHIRFDPSTAHTLLGMDTDRTSLWISEETDGDNITADSNGGTYCVLGGVAFSQGVHYWEVDVRVVASWALGVAYGGTHSLELDSASCWSLSYRQDKQQYCAHHQSLAFSFSARSAPSSIGLFLDLDSGILCFYDAGLSQTLHTFYCRFSLPLFPLFCLGQVTCNQSATQMMKVLDPVANQLPRT